MEQGNFWVIIPRFKLNQVYQKRRQLWNVGLGI